MRLSTGQAYAALAVVMTLWAGNSIVGRAVRDDVGPFLLSLIRWGGALIIVLPFAWPHLRRERAALIAAWKPVLALGLTGIAAFNALLYSGLHYTTASNGMLIQAALPALVLTADWLAYGSRPSGGMLAGVALSTLGVVLIVTRADIGVLIGLDFGRGDVLILIAATVWAIYTTLLKLRPQVNALSLLATTFMIGVCAIAPFAAYETIRSGPPNLTPTVIGGLAYVTVLPSLVAYLLYNTAVETLGAGRAGQASTLMPLLGALLAVAVLGERLQLYHLGGMVLILAGIVVTALTMRRSRAVAEPSGVV